MECQLREKTSWKGKAPLSITSRSPSSTQLQTTTTTTPNANLPPPLPIRRPFHRTRCSFPNPSLRSHCQRLRSRQPRTRNPNSQYPTRRAERRRARGSREWGLLWMGWGGCRCAGSQDRKRRRRRRRRSMADGDEYRVEPLLQEYGSERGMCIMPSLLCPSSIS